MKKRTLFALLTLLPFWIGGAQAQDIVDRREASFLPSPALPSPPESAPDEAPLDDKALSVPPPFTASENAAQQTGPIATPVASAPLEAVDPETRGLLSPTSGGLPTALWTGTKRAFVNTFLDAVMRPTASATLNDLARRVALSAVAAPTPSEGEGPTRSLIARRTELLLNLGAGEEAWSLTALAEPKLIDPLTLRRLAEVSVIGAHGAEVCEKIPSMMEAHGKTEEAVAEWQKVLLMCHLRAKDDKAVQLGLDLMREQQVKDDVFLSIMNRNVLGESKILPRQLTPLRAATLAALLQTGLPLPPELYGRAEAALIPALSVAPATQDEARLAMAERAAAQGVLTSAGLAQAYKQTPATPEVLATASSLTGKSARERALLYQAMKSTPPPASKHLLLQRFLGTQDSLALSAAQCRLLADEIETLAADPTQKQEQAALAPQAARVLILAGRPDKAMLWLQTAQDAIKEGGESIARPSTRDWPLRAVAGLEPDGAYAKGLAAWLDEALAEKTEQETGGTQAPNPLPKEKAGLTLLLLSALGYAVPEDAWLRVLTPTPSVKKNVPSPLLLARLAQAAQAQRTGETVLLSLVLMGEDRESAPTSVKIEIVRALRLTGLEAEAKGVAHEILAEIL